MPVVAPLALIAGLLGVSPLFAATPGGGGPGGGDPPAEAHHTHHDPTRGVDPRTKPTPTDTVAKSDKAKPDRTVPQLPAGASKKKSAKPRIIIPPSEQPAPQGRQAPDRPWETTFLVNNTWSSMLWSLPNGSLAREYR